MHGGQRCLRIPKDFIDVINRNAKLVCHVSSFSSLAANSQHQLYQRCSLKLWRNFLSKNSYKNIKSAIAGGFFSTAKTLSKFLPLCLNFFIRTFFNRFIYSSCTYSFSSNDRTLIGCRTGFLEGPSSISNSPSLSLLTGNLVFGARIGLYGTTSVHFR
jgi:hypothetical protein